MYLDIMNKIILQTDGLTNGYDVIDSYNFELIAGVKQNNDPRRIMIGVIFLRRIMTGGHYFT